MVLQAWKLEQEQLKEEEMSKKSKKENPPKGKQQKEEANTKKSKALSGDRKSRPETARGSAKAAPETIISENEVRELQLTEEPPYVRANTFLPFLV